MNYMYLFVCLSFDLLMLLYTQLINENYTSQKLG